MGEELLKALFAIGTAIIGLTVVSVLLAQQSQTSNVIKAATGGLATDIQAAVSPITGGGSGGGLLGGLGSLGSSGGIVYA
jgi:hypothetical protein